MPRRKQPRTSDSNTQNSPKRSKKENTSFNLVAASTTKSPPKKDSSPLKSNDDSQPGPSTSSKHPAGPRPKTAPPATSTFPSRTTCCTYDAALEYFTKFVNAEDVLEPVRAVQQKYNEHATLLQPRKKSDQEWQLESAKTLSALNQDVTDICIGIVMGCAIETVQELSKKVNGKKDGGTHKTQRSYAVDLESVLQVFFKKLDGVLEEVNKQK